MYFKCTFSTPRGPGFWKFNNALLKDENYVAIVWETYTNTLRFYEQVSDKRLLWKLIKMEIRDTTISYTKHKAKMSRDSAKNIRQQLEQLDEIICKDFFASDINQVLQCYDSLKSELQSLYEDKGKHAMFRAKCRWVENGERPTKYFFKDSLSTKMQRARHRRFHTIRNLNFLLRVIVADFIL